MTRATRIALVVTAALAVSAVAARADCLVDYKAKRDRPLQLHYGVIRLDDAECADPAQAIARRIAVEGWTLLTVMGRLSEADAQERQDDAGAYYLRY
ncbi:hypothetical protein [Palleronia sp.]|uniref:hypothetical protein n=1 Tax=Palleronia sp. TaxID=1940284 RepID=UPI0035C85EFB